MGNGGNGDNVGHHWHILFLGDGVLLDRRLVAGSWVAFHGLQQLDQHFLADVKQQVLPHHYSVDIIPLREVLVAVEGRLQDSSP